MREIVKKILPPRLVMYIRTYRKNRRDRRRFLYGQGKPYFKTVYDQGVSFDIEIDPYKNAGVDEVVAKNGVWEPRIGKVLKDTLPKSGVFVDIGANIGYYSLLAARLLGSSGKVFSYEPQKNIYSQFLRSVQKNKLENIEIHNCALSDHEGAQELLLREENYGGSTLLTLTQMETFYVDKVEVVTLIELDSQEHLFDRVDVIKIDVEGYEFEALKGAKRILKKFSPLIIMEFSPVFYRQENREKPESFVFFLEELGYHFFEIDGKLFDMKLWLSFEENRLSQIDIICRKLV